MSFGMLNTFGIYFTPLMAEFGWPRTALSAASALSFVMFGLFGIVAGRLGDRFDPRRVMLIFGSLLGVGYMLMSRVGTTAELYVFYGLIAGIGLGAMDVIPLSTVARWFTARRSTMTGVVKVGGGLGMLVMPLLAFQLISNYGWRASYLILGAVTLGLMAGLSRFLVRDPARKGLLPLGGSAAPDKESARETASPFRQLLRDKKFGIMVAIYVMTMFASRTLLVHVSPYALDLGMTLADGAVILATFGAVGMAGRIVIGIAGDRIGNRLSLVICATVLLFAFIWLQGATEFWMLVVFSAALGFSHGGFFTMLSPLVAELFGLGSHGMNFGIVMFSGTIGGAVGPLMAGRIFDESGSYHQAFVICTIASAAVVALTLILELTTRRRLTGRGTRNEPVAWQASGDGPPRPYMSAVTNR